MEKSFEQEYEEQQKVNRLDRYHVRQGYKQDPLYQIYTEAYHKRYSS